MQIKSRTYGNVFSLPTRGAIEVVRMVGLPPKLDVSCVNDGTEEKNYIRNKKWKYPMKNLQYIFNSQCSSWCKITSLIIHNLLREYKWNIFSKYVNWLGRHMYRHKEIRTYWHLWHTYFPIPLAFSLALHSRHRALKNINHSVKNCHFTLCLL